MSITLRKIYHRETTRYDLDGITVIPPLRVEDKFVCTIKVDVEYDDWARGPRTFTEQYYVTRRDSIATIELFHEDDLIGDEKELVAAIEAACGELETIDLVYPRWDNNGYKVMKYDDPVYDYRRLKGWVCEPTELDGETKVVV